MSDGPTAELADANADALHCRACGYDVRGISGLSPACPECGTPLAKTLAGDRLDAADPAWVHRLATGLSFSAVGEAVTFLLLFPDVRRAVLGQHVDPSEVDLRGWVVWLAATVLQWVGTWMLTTREPNVWKEPLGATLRLVLRGGVVADVVLRLGIPLAIELGDSGARPPLIVSYTHVLIALALTAVWWVYVRRIQLRIPRAGLATASQFTMVGLLVADFVRQVLPSLLIWMGRWETFLQLDESIAVRIGEGVFMLAAAALAAWTARELYAIAPVTHADEDDDTGQKPGGGESSQETGSPVRG